MRKVVPFLCLSFTFYCVPAQDSIKKSEDNNGWTTIELEDEWGDKTGETAYAFTSIGTYDNYLTQDGELHVTVHYYINKGYYVFWLLKEGRFSASFVGAVDAKAKDDNGNVIDIMFFPDDRGIIYTPFDESLGKYGYQVLDSVLKSNRKLRFFIRDSKMQESTYRFDLNGF